MKNSQMGERTYRPAKRGMAAALAVLLVLVVVVCGTVLYAQQLILQTLDGRQSRQQEQRVTQFSLREQMIKAQTDTRVRGWLSVAQREDVSIQTRRGELRGSVYQPVGEKEKTPWALVLHGGLGTDRNQVMDVVCALSLEGYAVLAPDLYAHGASDGTVSSLGLVDAQDVQAWCEWLAKERGATRIVLFGQDEGGVAALLAAAQGLPEQVCAVAADSAYASVSDRMLDLLYHAYGTESRMQILLLNAAYRLAHGVDAKDGELLEPLAACELPLLLIHGTGDSEVPAWHSEDLVEAGKNAQLLFAEGAAHGMARYAQAETYYAALLRFFDKAIE